MATFFTRLKETIGDRGYEACMRRSLQTIILYEAFRCLSEKLKSLRPFQRKLAFFDQCMALIAQIDFIPPRHKQEIMWRTGTSMETMNAEVAWKRVKSIEKELQKLAEKIRPLYDDGTCTHKQVCDAFVQTQYENLTGRKKTPCPLNWEHSHSNIIMCYRLYYRNGQLDPSFPPPTLAKDIVVPAEKPARQANPYYITMSNYVQPLNGAPSAMPPTPNMQGGMNMPGTPIGAPMPSPAPPTHPGAISSPLPSTQSPQPQPQQPQPQSHHDVNESDIAAIVGGADEDENRRLLLKEVRENLDLLKEFEGVISEEEIKKRKRDLFLALPPPPPARRTPRLSDNVLGP